MTLRTVKDNLRDLLDRICDKTKVLIGQYSSLEDISHPGGNVTVINLSGSYRWLGLPPEGIQLQSDILPEFRRFVDLMNSLVRALPTASRKSYRDAAGELSEIIDQNRNTSCKTPAETVARVNKLRIRILEVLDHFAKQGEASYVIPDTNALLINTAIETWSFSGLKRFWVVLTPTVLKELDSLKMNNRNSQVRAKAKKIIGIIKEFRRRGSLIEGVVVAKDKIFLKSVAQEPDVTKALRWLDPQNADDRFLASVLEFMKSHIESTVVIVTADINLQNKAEIASIPFIEPPTPKSKSKK